MGVTPLMAQYFFDVINSFGLVEDLEGQELRDISAARLVAIEAVRSIIRDDVTVGLVDLVGRVEVRDADRQLLVAIPFSDAVELRGADAVRAAP